VVLLTFILLKLEREIQQKNFKSAQQKLAVNILFSCNWLNAHYAVFFKGLDITVQQFNVLRILRGQAPTPCALKVIKERMLDRMSDASRIVDKLVAKKYVVRRQCPGDRRAVNLVISERGLQLLEKLDFIDDATRNIFKNISEEETERLNDLLDKMRG
jgi:DNA-binding MarR family transcriptional regulator